MKEVFGQIKTIPNSTEKEFLINIKLRPFVMTCSISGITESMNIEVKYVSGSKLIETASFREAFKHSELKTSFEELCSGLFDYLNSELQPLHLSVRCFRDDNKVIDWGVEYSNFN